MLVRTVAIWIAFAASPPAEAACSISLVEPADGALVTASPPFAWTGDCTSYRLWTWKDGDFPNRQHTGWSAAVSRQLPEDTWDASVSAAATVQWAVQGRGLDGSVDNYSSTSSMTVGHDGDDDGNTVEAGDCDDADPAVSLGENGCHRSLYGTVSIDLAETQLLPRFDGDYLGMGTLLVDLDGDGRSEIGVTLGEHAVLISDPGAGAPPIDTVTTTWIAGLKNTRSLSAPGDVDGDGQPDLLVQTDDSISQRTPNQGIGYVFSGPPAAEVVADDSYARLVGEEILDLAGAAGQRGVGDVNGDGFVDLAVGMSGTDGRVYLELGPVANDRYLLGASDLVLTSAEPWIRLGQRTTGADWDADGLSDLIAEANTFDGAGVDRGAVFVVVSPPPTGALDIETLAAATLEGDDGDQAGAGFAPMGDLDGDGIEDLAIPANYADELHLESGGTMGTVTLSSTGFATLLGAPGGGITCVASAGDFDGDGAVDLVVGAANDDPLGGEAGAAYVALGPFAGTTSLDTAAIHVLGRPGDYLGFSVSGGGDVDGDGYPDALVSSIYANDLPGDTGGAVWVLFGGPPP